MVNKLTNTVKPLDEVDKINEIIDAVDEVVTDLNGKADVDLSNCTKPHIVETYINGTSWYRVYSDGWCEQGGYVTGGVNWSPVSVTLLKAYKDTNYNVFKGWVCSSAINPASYDATGSAYGTKYTTSFSTYNGAWDGFYWQTAGYIN